MPELALAIYAVFVLLAVGLRALLQWRATGSTGIVVGAARFRGAELLAGVLFGTAVMLAPAAPILALADVVEPVEALDTSAANATGLALAVLGLGFTLYAQVAMGRSWRIGVDPDERTELVTGGPFALVRNPIFSAMIPTGLGIALMVPSAVAITAFVALVAALELQVRAVEEPHLLRVHGETYRRYAERTGRFVPGVGRLRARGV